MQRICYPKLVRSKSFCEKILNSRKNLLDVIIQLFRNTRLTAALPSAPSLNTRAAATLRAGFNYILLSWRGLMKGNVTAARNEVTVSEASELLQPHRERNERLSLYRVCTFKENDRSRVCSRLGLLTAQAAGTQTTPRASPRAPAGGALGLPRSSCAHAPRTSSRSPRVPFLTGPPFSPPQESHL